MHVYHVHIRQNMSYNTSTGAIFIKHLRGKLKLRENFGTELQQNQRTLQSLVLMVGCGSNSV